LKTNGRIRKIVLCPFVKTPKIDAAKTRLASQIGMSEAINIYTCCIENLFTVSKEIEKNNIETIWALASPMGLSNPIWNQKQTIVQAGETLNERIINAFNELRRKYEYIVFCASDVPAFSAKVLINAIEHTSSLISTTGPSPDGGFYMLGLSNLHDIDFISKLRLGTIDTFSDLLKYTQYSTKIIQPLTDIDTIDSFLDVLKELRKIKNKNIAQITILNTLEKYNV